MKRLHNPAHLKTVFPAVIERSRFAQVPLCFCKSVCDPRYFRKRRKRLNRGRGQIHAFFPGTICALLCENESDSARNDVAISLVPGFWKWEERKDIVVYKGWVPNLYTIE